MDDIDDFMKVRRGFQKWNDWNSEEYSPAGKSQSEGDGERKLAKEFFVLGVKKNPGGENSFPDLVVGDRPFGEVKAVTRGRQINMGRHTEFSDRIRELIYDRISGGKKVEFKLARKLLGGHIGKKLLEENLSAAEWSGLQKEFLKDYIKKAGGRLFLVSEEGFVCIDSSSWDQLEIVAISSSSISMRPRKSARPFA